MAITAAELLAATASRLLADHKIVFAGVGTPLLASALAKSAHAPHLTIVVEGGVVGLEVLPDACRSPRMRCGPGGGR